MTSLVKAEKAEEKDRVLVRTEAVRPRKAQAPTGSGPRTRPAMVERKMESNCQAWRETSGGLGTRNCTMRPMEIEISKGMGLAPCGAGDGDGEFVEEEAWMGGTGRRGLEQRESVGDGGKKEEEEDRTAVRKERGRAGPGRINGGDLEMGRWRWWRREKEVEAEVEREWRAKLSMFCNAESEGGEQHLFGLFIV